MQRYFVSVCDKKVVFEQTDIHHILHVMRMKINDEIEVVASGKLYDAIIKSIDPLEVVINYEIPSDSELPYPVTLFYPLAKGDKIDLVIQKTTELGVNKIVLFSSERCIVKWDNKEKEKKLARFYKIAKEASEQSHRIFVPEIAGVYSLIDIPNELFADINLFAYEKKAGNTKEIYDILTNRKGSISIVVGPEGGFSEKEAEIVENKYHFSPISLGKRILRSETAAIYALSVIGFNLEK